ncbi:MAG: hypothetical protein WC154_06845 [Candidatus Izemoplasmatales bacterium]|jgi:hypothetical protein
MNNYKYARFYDFCVKDDYKNPGRGVIRRKERIVIGILAYILFAIYILLFLTDIYRSVALLVIISITCLGFMYETRTDLISLLNYFKVKAINHKSSLSILEKFALYYNRDGNYIKIQEKQMVRIKYYPFNWTVVKIVFKDNYNNKYVFKISLKTIFIKVVLSKSRRDNYIENVERKTKIQYNLNDLKSIKSAKDFMIFIRDKYRQIRETISC